MTPRRRTTHREDDRGPSRRSVLAGIGGGALGALVCGRAIAGGPALVIGASRHPDGAFRVGDIDGRLGGTEGAVAPVRLHALCPRADRREAVAIARRPGDLALVLDGEGRTVRAAFRATDGCRFSGHGAYVDGGSGFVTTEIDAASGEGRLALRDVAGGYAPRTVFASGGLGPHEVIASGRFMAVANGAREPKSDPGVAALERTEARSNLVLLEPGGGGVETAAALDPSLESLSLRHLARLPEGGVLVAAQDRDAGARDRPLIFRLAGDRLAAFDEELAVTPSLAAYVGSLCVDRSGRFAAASSPKGGVVAVFEVSTGVAIGTVAAPDVCGLAPDVAPGRFVATTGLGEILRIAVDGDACAVVERRSGALRWDNHLAALA